MTDLEVGRLRRLRGRALRTRAVARVLGSDERSDENIERLLQRGSCAAWRVARAVSGRLRSHPYARFQRGASVATVVSNSLVAKAAQWAASTPTRRLSEFEVQLKSLSRELDDARSLTRDAELSDAFGRSQREIRELTDLLEHQIRGEAPRPLLDKSRSLQRRPTTPEGDWPYLAF